LVVASVTEEGEEEQPRKAENQQRIVEAEAAHQRTRNNKRNETEAKINAEVEEQREARSGDAVAHLHACNREETLQRQAALALVAAPAEQKPRPQLMSSLQAAAYNVPVLMPGRAYVAEEEEVSFDEERIDEPPADDLSVESMNTND
jgi:hypothetical protein